MEKMRKRNLSKILPWGILILSFMVSVGMFAAYGQHNIDSDMSSEMVLAQTLNVQGGIFSENWFYSTELRVVSPVPVYQLALRLFDSWHAARTFSIAVLMAGVTGALLYALRGMGIQEAGVYAAAVMILPLSKFYAFTFSYGGFYTMYFIVTCLLLGWTVRLPKSKHPVIQLAAIAALSIWSGMNGVRMLMICGVPLMLAAAWRLFDDIRTGEKEEIRKTGMLFLGAFVVLAGMAVGYLYNKQILTRYYWFTQYSEESVMPFDTARLLAQVDNWLDFFGYRTDVLLMSLSGIASVMCVFLTAAVMAAPILLLRDREFKNRLIPQFALSALLVGIVANRVTNRDVSAYNVAYYIAGMLFSVVCLFILLDRVRTKAKFMRTVLLLGAVSAFGMQAFNYYQNEFHIETQPYETAADYLMEQGYTEGYATFWNANVLTEASDGALDVYVWNVYTNELYEWLQRIDHTYWQPEGPVFVYVGNDDKLHNCPNAPDHLLKTLDNGALYGYDSVEQMNSMRNP